MRAPIAHAAEIYPIRAFEEGQFPKVGLVFGLMQDQRGVIWIWGSRGITTYDGSRFTHYSTEQGLPSNYVYNIREESNGTLAICTYKGLVLLKPGSLEFEQGSDPSYGPVRDVVFHPLGLVLATDHGVILLHEGEYYLMPNLRKEDLKSRTAMVSHLDWDPVQNQVWASTDRWGLLRLNMDALPPLLDLDPTHERPESIIYDPLVSGPEVPSASQAGHFLMTDSTGRFKTWHRVSTLFSRPESGTKSWLPSGWSTYGVVFDHVRARVIVWDNFNAYTVTHNKIERVIQFPTNVSLNSVVLLKDGRLSFARNDGLYILEKDESLHRISAMNGLPSDIVINHLVDQEGHLWFVSNHGDLYRMTTTAIHLYSTKQFPILQDLRQTLVTKDGEILAASSKGIVSIKKGKLRTLISFDGLESDFINFAVDRRGNLLVGLTTRLYLYDRRAGKLRPLTDTQSPNVGEMDIATDGDGNLRFVFQELLRKWDGDELKTYYFDTYSNPLFIDAGPGNRLHIGQWIRLITIDSWGMRMLTKTEARQRQDLRPGVGPEIRLPMPKDMFLDNMAAKVGAVGPDGAYWVGTFNAGIVRLEESADPDSVIKSIKVFDTRNGLPTNQVNHLSRDPEGNLYFTLAKGAVMVTRDSLETIDLSIPQDAIIQDVLRINHTYTAVATSQGLFLATDDKRYGIDRNLGLSESAVSKLLLLPDKRILAQQQNGFYIVDPSVLDENDRLLHRPIVMEFYADGIQRDLNKPIVIKSRRRSLRAQISLPDYFNESLHSYSWILDPFEEKWRPWSNQTTIEYTNIPPGEYTLRIKARNGIDARETFSTPITIQVPPRFHETALFMLIMVLGSTLLVMLLVLWIVNRQQRNQRKNMNMEMEKLRVANQLAATIAHEFNNPLQVMQGAYFMLKREDIDEPTRNRYLELLPKYIERMRDLIQRLLRLRDIREVDYAAGLKILDVVGTTDPETDEDIPSDSDAAK